MALLIIDMQNDFVKEGAVIEVKGIRKKMSKFKEFIEALRNNGVFIVYSKHIFDPKLNPIEAELFPILNSEGLREGTSGADIYSKIYPQKGDLIIKKRRYDAFYKTNLEKKLRLKKINHVIITGTMTNVCCESTARTAMMKDFKVLFCSDLTFASERITHKNSLKTLSTHFAKILTSKEIIKIVSNSQL